MTFGNRFKLAALSLMVASVSALPVMAQEHAHPAHKEGEHNNKSALELAAVIGAANAATAPLMASGYGEGREGTETISEEEGLACLRGIAPHDITLTAHMAKSLASSDTSKEFVSVGGRSPADSGKDTCSLSASILNVQKAHSGSYNVTVNLSYMYGGRSSGVQDTTKLIKTLTFEPDAVSKKKKYDGTLIDALSAKDVRYIGTLSDAHGNALLSMTVLGSDVDSDD